MYSNGIHNGLLLCWVKFIYYYYTIRGNISEVMRK
nr:MAG TPA: hypothetical protein [Caudoviricetes sp.]